MTDQGLVERIARELAGPDMADKMCTQQQLVSVPTPRGNVKMLDLENYYVMPLWMFFADAVRETLDLASRLEDPPIVEFIKP